MFSGSSEPRLLFTVSPSVENMRSDWACVAGIARTRWATRARYGNSMALSRHMSGVGIGYTRDDAAGAVEGDGSFRHVCVCGRVDLPASAAVSQGVEVSPARS